MVTQQTTMQIYQGLVLECQHCYAICRYQEAAVRRNCPHCGLPIANWDALSSPSSPPATEEAPSS